MIINVNVIVPDGRHCYDCDYLAISGCCALFRSKLRKYRTMDNLFDKCLACLNAKDVSDEEVAYAQDFKAYRPEREPCEMCGIEELPQDADSHDFYVWEGNLWHHDTTFGWEGSKINRCPMCGRRLEE